VSRRPLALACALVAVALGGCGASSPGEGSDGAGMVAAWNLEAERTIVDRGGQPPWASTMSFAMVHVAVFDAVNAITRRYRPYVAALRADPSDSREAAAAAAAHGVLAALFPAQRGRLDAALRDSLGVLPDAEATRRGARLGGRAAAAVLADRAGDGRPSRAVRGGSRGSTEVGRWRVAPPARGGFGSAWVASVRPFVLDRVSRLRSAGPRSLRSRRYARELAEVRRLGERSSTARTPEQTAVARFWSNDMMVSWSRALRSVAAERRLSTTDAARTFAMAALAGADGAIACWDDKAHHAFWRPVTAIRAAGRDTNPWTRPARGWTPLLDTPPFPEHPSGHACIGAAVFGASAVALGGDRIAFSLRSPASGATRRFRRLSQAVEEVGEARIFAGAHFRSASDQGAAIGRGVVRRLRDRHLQPLPAACRPGFTRLAPTASREATRAAAC
jgi:hypothetical protein